MTVHEFWQRWFALLFDLSLPAYPPPDETPPLQPTDKPDHQNRDEERP